MKFEPNKLLSLLGGVILACVPILIVMGGPGQYTEKEIAVLDKVILCQ